MESEDSKLNWEFIHNEMHNYAMLLLLLTRRCNLCKRVSYYN